MKMKSTIALLLLLLAVGVIANCGGLFGGDDGAALGGDAAHGDHLRRVLLHRYRR